MFSDQKIIPRMRVILCNDFAGDPDGLVQLAHHLLSPSVEISGIIGSFFSEFFDEDPSSQNACAAVYELLDVMKLKDKYHVCKGANGPLNDPSKSDLSDGAKFIIEEALRDDSNLPLYVLCGASLTDAALAFLKEPKISEKLTIIWIGGNEYSPINSELSICPSVEYNLDMDINSAKIIFSSPMNLWQVPRDTYRQVLMTYSELLCRVKPFGDTGNYLAEKIEDVMKISDKNGVHLGETYVMGDSPLVLLTALQSGFDPDPSSSSFVLKHAPDIGDNGRYIENESNRKIRVYERLDSRVLMEDFYAKLFMYSKTPMKRSL